MGVQHTKTGSRELEFRLLNVSRPREKARRLFKAIVDVLGQFLIIVVSKSCEASLKKKIGGKFRSGMLTSLQFYCNSN
jgi:hypothetical protein